MVSLQNRKRFNTRNRHTQGRLGKVAVFIGILALISGGALGAANWSGKAQIAAIEVSNVKAAGTVLSSTRQAQSSWVLDLAKIPNLMSRTGCPIRAWVHDSPGNYPPSPPNQAVTFYDSQSMQQLTTVNTDNAGRASLTVRWGTNVVAKMNLVGYGPLTSNVFGCPANPTSQH